MYRKSRDVAVRLFKQHIDSVLSGEIVVVPQGSSDCTSHRAAELDHASRIDLDAPTTARRVLNTIRARTFPPHPSATLRTTGGLTWFAIYN